MTNRQSTSKLHSFTDLVEIGRGGFGVVYSAKRENGEKVALKKIDGRVSRERVWNEIKSMRTLKHRNIVEFYEDFADGDATYVVMELCELGSLRAYVRNNGPLEEQIAAHVLRQLISAVTYMHRRGVLHRDLSAGNVFIKSIRRNLLIVKLGDFGLATNLRQGEMACTIVGTPGYIAPQVFNQDYDQSADVFSLGGVLYTMLTSRDPPSKGFISPNGLSSNARNLVEKMMHVDAKRRIALTEIAMSDFMRDLADDPSLGISREFSVDRRLQSRERGRSMEKSSGRSGERRVTEHSRERKIPTRSASQPICNPRRLSITNRPINDRPPTTSSQRDNDEIWPLNLMRCGGQRIRTAGGRYIVESDTRARFEVAAKGDVITRIIVVEQDPIRRFQKVQVHRISERRERCRKEDEEFIELSRTPQMFTSHYQLPADVKNDYSRLAKMIMTTIRSRVPKITFRRPPQFPDAAAQLMENGDMRVKFSRSLIIRKCENGEIFNCIDGEMSKKEGVHGSTLIKVNEVYNYLTKFEECLQGMGSLTCFPINFSAGSNISTNSSNSPYSIMPSTASSQQNTRFPFSNISNMQSQIPRSAPFQVNRHPAEKTKQNENGQEGPKFKFKMDKTGRIIGIHARDNRFLRQSTRDPAQFIFTDPAIRSDEMRFRRSEKPPERAGELLHHLLPQLSIR